MKTKQQIIFVAAIALVQFAPAFASAHTHTLSPSSIPDLPPDASSAQHSYVLKQSQGNKPQRRATDGLEAVVTAGERNLEWLQHINSFRPAGDKLSFTSKATQSGSPIDKPSEYNPTLIKTEFIDRVSLLPKELNDVLIQNQPFTDTPPIDVATYLELCRKLDRTYQSALRWRMMKPWLSELAENRKGDIRGFYFLSRLSDREQILADYAALAPAEKLKVRDALIGMCFNDNDDFIKCERRVQKLIDAQADLNPYYRSILPKAQETFDNYFKIQASSVRTDFSWSMTPDGKSSLITPFLDPKKNDVRYFVQHNIQDEWQLGSWQLKLPFVNSGPHAYIVFEKGVTPHVDGLGGSKIVMNADQPLTEYDAQWIIRHEFGHVLGLPDCYVEFYVAEREVIVNYQIDVENIMCSRRGHVKQENVDELARVYSH